MVPIPRIPLATNENQCLLDYQEAQDYITIIKWGLLRGKLTLQDKTFKYRHDIVYTPIAKKFGDAWVGSNSKAIKDQLDAIDFELKKRFEDGTLTPR